MHLGFFVQGLGTHWDIAKYLLLSSKARMPGVPVIQLTDEKTPEVSGVDGVFRLGGKIPMAIRRMRLHSMLGGDWLFVDSDIVIQKDVTNVFASPFDIAVTDRVGSLWEHSPDVKDMPYNMGVTFSRSPEFWARAAKILEKAPEPLQEWCGDQLVVCELQKQYKTKVLPGQVYNFTPAKRDEDRSHAAIVHYKGTRKGWIDDGNHR